MVEPMLYRLLAEALVAFHFLFVLFVIAGGFVVLRWRWTMWLHLPAAAWGIFVEMTGTLCPLTPLENNFRAWGGEGGYEGGFIEHYIRPVLYPEGLTSGAQIVLGCLIVLINVICYSGLYYQRQRTRERAQSGLTAIG
jgi:hypothetical protein